MRTRPWFHAGRKVPLTGREPVLGPLLTRLAWCGPGWGSLLLSGERGSGLTRLLDEVVRRRRGEGVPPPVRVLPAPEDDAPLEPIRRALLGALGPIGRDETFLRLAAALGGKRGAARRLVAWMLDGPDAGAATPDSDLVAEALRAVSPSGPLIADDLTQLDAASREIVLGEGGSGGIGVLAATTGRVAEAGDLWAVPPLGEAQVDLMLRRWLRHPVTVRRLRDPVLERTGGWPGRIVRDLRALGRRGILTSGSRGVEISAWPPDWADDPQDGAGFARFVSELRGAERAVFEVAALQAFEEDGVLLARAAGVKSRVVIDLEQEVRERWPRATGGLFPSIADRAQVAGSLEPERRRAHAAELLRAWRRRPLDMDRGVRDAVARLRVAVMAEDSDACDESVGLLARFLPGGRALSPSLERLLERAGSGGAEPTPPAVPDFREFHEAPADPPHPDRMREARRRLGEDDLAAAGAILESIAGDDAVAAAEQIEALIRLAHTRLRAGDEIGAHEAIRGAAERLGGVERDEDEPRLRRLLALTSGVLGTSLEAS